LEHTNKRLLNDASANLFITCFYGVLDTKTGTLNYSNAGHHPPFLVSDSSDSILSELERTGMPIGVDEEAIWQTGTIQLSPGDKLVIFSDGATDAENSDGEFFGYPNLRKSVLEGKNGNAFELQAKILEAIQGFTNSERQSDDLTLMVIARETKEENQSDY
jgi:sigma-B regulation protein RsbU (phosphoserine phosphatase)